MMSELLGYFYVLPISIMLFLVLWAIKRGRESAHRKPISSAQCEKEAKKRKAELGQEV